MAAAAVLAAAAAGRFAAGLYVEASWFSALGYGSRFWRLEGARLIASALVWAFSSAVLFAVVWGGGRGAGTVRVRRRFGNIEIAEALPRRRVRAWVAGLSAAAGLLVAAPVGASLGRDALFALGSVAFGAGDAVAGRDPRTYLFLLPLARGIWAWMLALAVWSGLLLVAVLVLTRRIRFDAQSVQMDAFARRRLVWGGAALLLLLGGHFAVSAVEAVGGAPIDYATVHGEIPGRRLLAVVGALAAVALLWGEWTGRFRFGLAGVATLAVLWPLSVGIYPELIRRFRVEPDELRLERPFLAANIDATRAAWALKTVEERPYRVHRDPPPRATLDRWTAGLPLWDERPLKATYDQLQGLLAYHEFPDVDNDRYGRPGATEQVAVAVREFSPGRLAAAARTWLNLHLRYTHGTGAVVSPVDRVTRGGEPEYWLRDLPPRTVPEAPAGIALEEPRVFFGERTTRFAVVSPDSFADGLRPAAPALRGFWRRLAHAWVLGSKNLLLRGDLGAGDLLLWRRTVVERVRALVPFLLVDPDPAPVLVGGRIRWIVDLYAVADRYPLSEPAVLRGRRLNYVRDAARAVVDGVTGEVRLYRIAEGAEPLLDTWEAVFPGLLRPLAELPPELRRHLRYPRALLQAQAEILEAYHLVDPDEFYRKQDLWSLAREVYEDRPVPVRPYYLLMPFPGAADAQAEFLLTVPFTPRNRDNLTAFLLARSDPGRYGELALYRVNVSGQVFGPRQVEVQIDQDPAISQQLSLWRQLGSRATRGHLLLVPVEGFLLYVEPLFLEAEDREGAAPGLKRVIASAGDRVAMAETLAEALDALLEQLTAPGDDETAVGQRRTPAAVDAGELEALLRRADEALRQGDLARFGTLWERVRERLHPAAAPAAEAGEENP